MRSPRGMLSCLCSELLGILNKKSMTRRVTAPMGRLM
jgi:hypothetical protein